MSLKGYFEGVKGRGILATADKSGKVNAAVFAKPHFLDEGFLGFIMRDNLTHHNLQSNLSAVYLFIEADRVAGVRIYLRKVKEEKDSALLNSIRRVRYEGDEDVVRYLVFFDIEGILPLVGSDAGSIPFTNLE